MDSKIEPHKTKKYGGEKTPALKRGFLQNYRFGTREAYKYGFVIQKSLFMVNSSSRYRVC